MSSIAKLCSVEGCERKRHAKSLCVKHYKKLLKYGDPLAGTTIELGHDPTCSVNGCNKPHKAQGYCRLHYERFKKYDTPDLNFGECIVSGCKSLIDSKSRLYCSEHMKISIRYTGSPEFKAWAHMNGRCCNPNDKGYKDYGGRGIKVCERWRDCFLNFLLDMGDKPSPEYSLDRINVNEHYTPDNCRWTTKTVQAINTRMRKNNTSGYHGVYRRPSGRWFAAIGHLGKIILLGTYESKEEAARAYNKAALIYHGSDAKLNDV